MPRVANGSSEVLSGWESGWLSCSVVFVFVYCWIKHQLVFSCHNQADGSNGCLCAAADSAVAAAEAKKGLEPVDEPRCESIRGLSGTVKAEVLMEIQSGPRASGICTRNSRFIPLPSCTFSSNRNRKCLFPLTHNPPSFSGSRQFIFFYI